MSTGGLESMIFRVFVVVFVDGFVLMLVILSAMRALYALGVCQPPQISTDHARNISLERFESQTHQTARSMAEAPLTTEARVGAS
jgi:hypothetical protein